MNNLCDFNCFYLVRVRICDVNKVLVSAGILQLICGFGVLVGRELWIKIG